MAPPPERILRYLPRQVPHLLRGSLRVPVHGPPFPGHDVGREVIAVPSKKKGHRRSAKKSAPRKTGKRMGSAGQQPTAE